MIMHVILGLVLILVLTHVQGHPKMVQPPQLLDAVETIEMVRLVISKVIILTSCALSINGLRRSWLVLLTNWLRLLTSAINDVLAWCT